MCTALSPFSPLAPHPSGAPRRRSPRRRGYRTLARDERIEQPWHLRIDIYVGFATGGQLRDEPWGRGCRISRRCACERHLVLAHPAVARRTVVPSFMSHVRVRASAETSCAKRASMRINNDLPPHPAARLVIEHLPSECGQHGRRRDDRPRRNVACGLHTLHNTPIPPKPRIRAHVHISRTLTAVPTMDS